MLSALRAETLRLTTLRSTLVYAILLTGALYGPIVLITMFATGESAPLNHFDLSQTIMIFGMVAIAFAGATTANEIRRGSTSISFLTQRFRWPSFVARLVVVTVFLAAMFAVGMLAVQLVGLVHPAGLELGGDGWAYLGVGLAHMIFWALIAVCIAALTRSTVAAVTIPMVWLLLLENLISVVPYRAVQNVAEWLPLTNWNQIMESTMVGPEGVPAPHSVGAAVAAVAAVLVAFLAAGLVSHTRRDVPA